MSEVFKPMEQLHFQGPAPPCLSFSSPISQRVSYAKGTSDWLHVPREHSVECHLQTESTEFAYDLQAWQGHP